MHTNFVIVPTFVYKKIPYKLEVWEYADGSGVVNVMSEKGGEYFFTAKLPLDSMAPLLFDAIDGIDNDAVEISHTPFAP